MKKNTNTKLTLSSLNYQQLREKLFESQVKLTSLKLSVPPEGKFDSSEFKKIKKIIAKCLTFMQLDKNKQQVK
jgi:ribosomal protein L29